MYNPDKEFDILSRPAIISIPTSTPIHKMDVVKDFGLGIWFADTDLPSIVINTENEKQAIEILQGFNRGLMKTKIKIVKG